MNILPAESTEEHAKINNWILKLLIINIVALSIQLIIFKGLPSEIFERILYISSGIFFAINILVLTSQYTPGIITEIVGNTLDAKLKGKQAAVVISIVFLFLGVMVFGFYLGLHYLVR